MTVNILKIFKSKVKIQLHQFGYVSHFDVRLLLDDI